MFYRSVGYSSSRFSTRHRCCITASNTTDATESEPARALAPTTDSVSVSPTHAVRMKKRSGISLYNSRACLYPLIR